MRDRVRSRFALLPHVRTCPRWSYSAREEPLAQHRFLPPAAATWAQRRSNGLPHYRHHMHWRGRGDWSHVHGVDTGRLASDSDLARRVADRGWRRVCLWHSAKQPQDYSPLEVSSLTTKPASWRAF